MSCQKFKTSFGEYAKILFPSAQISINELPSMILHTSNDDRAKTATICWAIWIFRNDILWNDKHSGVFQRAIQSFLVITVNPSLAEALEYKKTLPWLLHNNFDHITIESDSMEVITKLNASLGNTAKSLISIVIGDCHALLASFSDISFQHIRRVANNAADLLTQHIFISK